MIAGFFAVILAYLIGSIPTGYIFGKVLMGIDIREHGSGNVGATNVFRTIGKIPAFAVLAIDFAKGFIAVTLLPFIFAHVFRCPLNDSTINWYILMGAAAIMGHIWTVFLEFRGGKGVATTAGVLAGLSVVLFCTALAVWVIVFVVWRYVSLASISAATALPVLSVAFNKDVYFVVFCSIFCLLGVITHRSNIRRLLQGKEKKLF